MDDQQIPAFQPSVDISGQIQRLERPWGFRLYQDSKAVSCINGLIHVDKGECAQLTIDVDRQRSWFIVNGRGAISWKNEQGELVKAVLKPGVGYPALDGKDYQLEAITDCDVIELVKG